MNDTKCKICGDDHYLQDSDAGSDREIYEEYLIAVGLGDSIIRIE